jgi:large subunit ribosomal protein L15e
MYLLALLGVAFTSNKSVRVRVRRGGRKRPVRKGKTMGKPKNQGVTGLKSAKNLQQIAEERAARKAPNLRVLNSYWVNQDATYKFYEVILVDVAHQAIRNDVKVNWLARPEHKGRANRGLTAAGRKARGLRKKGHAATKTRPSKNANWKRRNTLSLRRYR